MLTLPALSVKTGQANKGGMAELADANQDVRCKIRG